MRPIFININTFSIFCCVVFLFAGCDDEVENPLPPNEEELITSVILTFSQSTGADKVAIWRDLDGPGGNPPGQIDDIVLDNGIEYTLTIKFLNESNPGDIKNITEEVEEESDEHQVFFTGNAIDFNINYTYADEDMNGNPVGLNGTIDAVAIGIGSLIVTLKHQPGIKDATTDINDGDTDIQVEFNLEVI